MFVQFLKKYVLQQYFLYYCRRKHQSTSSLQYFFCSFFSDIVIYKLDLSLLTLKFQSSSRDKFILGFRLWFVRFWMLWMLVPGKKKGFFYKKNYCIQLNKSNLGNILPGWKMMKASSKHFFQSVQEQQHKGKKKERKKNNNCKAF